MEGSSLFEPSVRKAIRSANAPSASGQFIICSVQQNVPDYSYGRASMGSRLAARKAGNMPLQTPTRARIDVEINRILGATIKRMSPASPCLAKALYRVKVPTENETKYESRMPQIPPTAV